MGKSTISMAMFNSYVKLPEGRTSCPCRPTHPSKIPEISMALSGFSASNSRKARLKAFRRRPRGEPKINQRSLPGFKGKTSPETIWLVVSTPLKNIIYCSQWEGLSHLWWKNKKCSKPPLSHFLLRAPSRETVPDLCGANLRRSELYPIQQWNQHTEGHR